MWQARPHVERLKMRLNEDDRQWRILHRNQWCIPETFYGSATATLHFESAKRVTVASEIGYPQKILIADIGEGIILGVVNISFRGAISMGDGQGTPIDQAFPWLQSKMVTAIIGTFSVFTISATDAQGKDTDIIRHKPNAKRLYLPRVFAKGTPTYYEQEDQSSPRTSRAPSPADSVASSQAARFDLRPIAPRSVSVSNPIATGNPHQDGRMAQPMPQSAPPYRPLYDSIEATDNANAITAQFERMPSLILREPCTHAEVDTSGIFGFQGGSSDQSGQTLPPGQRTVNSRMQITASTTSLATTLQGSTVYGSGEDSDE